MSEEKKTVTETINMTEESREELRKTLTQTDRPDAGKNASGDVDVTGIIDEYADLSDTMIAGKTIAMNAVPSETIQMDPPKAETVRMTKTQIPSETIQMNAPAPSSETGEEQAADQKAAEEQKKAAEEQPLDPETEAIKKKIIERKKEKIRKARNRRIRFWTILIFLVAAIGSFIFSISGFFTVDSIEVRGNKHFTAEEIINIGHAVPGHNIIYDPGKQEIIDYLEQNPYIKTADVTRKLPSTLVITVNERAEACVFRYDDDYLVMDDQGILLKKSRTEPKITMIKGLVVTKLKLGEKIGTQDPKLFSNVLKIIRSMKAADMYFVTVDMTNYENDYQVRAYIYDNLVVRSDLNSLIENLDNGRLHKITDKLFEDGVSRGTIILGDDGSASFEPGI